MSLWDGKTYEWFIKTEPESFHSSSFKFIIFYYIFNAPSDKLLMIIPIF
jgi:hypothetical protein